MHAAVLARASVANAFVAVVMRDVTDADPEKPCMVATDRRAAHIEKRATGALSVLVVVMDGIGMNVADVAVTVVAVVAAAVDSAQRCDRIDVVSILFFFLFWQRSTPNL